MPVGPMTRPQLTQHLLDCLTRWVSCEYAVPVGWLPKPFGFLGHRFTEALNDTVVKGERRQTVNVPAEVVKWGSDGTSPCPWKFKQRPFNTYFGHVFKLAEEGMRLRGYNLSLDKNDLFHGHVFSFTNHAGKADLGILFHAKEYPRDLATPWSPGADANFTTADESYKLRNMVWVASSSRLWAIKSTVAKLAPLVLPDWASPNPTEEWMKEYVELFLKANTLQDNYFNALGTRLGSVNYFTRRTVKELTRNSTKPLPTGGTGYSHGLYFI
eukprot:Sspe_Gene.118377::Locus_111675_Transcript_1_1_Confidence_1.000_Length_1024::g.118377::m.118377